MCYDHEQRDVSELLEKLFDESPQAKELVLAIFTDEKKDFEVVRRIQQPVWISNSVYYTDEFPSWR
jgi:hypothetical protein